MLKASMVVATIPVTDLDRAERFLRGGARAHIPVGNPASVRFRALRTFCRAALTVALCRILCTGSTLMRGCWRVGAEPQCNDTSP